MPLLFTLFASFVLLLAPSYVLAQGTGVRLPTDEEIQKAQNRAREAMQRVPDANTSLQVYGGGMPKVDALPRAGAAAPDIASIAEKYKALHGLPAAMNKRTDLMVLVSLSMPKEALERTVDQAERAGAVLVFRGLKGNSIMRMSKEIQSIIGKRNVAAAIHPTAFKQFSVDMVPTVVIARQEAGDVLDNGCSKSDTFVKVSGDISLDHALEYIERKSQAWSDIAKAYRNRIVKWIN